MKMFRVSIHPSGLKKLRGGRCERFPLKTLTIPTFLYKIVFYHVFEHFLKVFARKPGFSYLKTGFPDQSLIFADFTSSYLQKFFAAHVWLQYEIEMTASFLV